MTDKLDLEIDRLRAKLADLAAENRTLRRRRRDGRHGRILRRAHRDALFLAMLEATGQRTSRAAILELGTMSYRRWYWARALLQVARVHDGRTFTVEDAQTVVQAVQRTVARLEAEGIEALIMRLPLSYKVAGSTRRKQKTAAQGGCT